MTTAYRTNQRVDTAIVRIFNTYGRRMRPNDGRAIPTFIRQALTGEPVTVAGDGSQTRSICHVSDTVDGILRLAHSGEPGPINIGNPDERSVLEIAHDVVAAAGSGSPIQFVDRPVDDPGARRPDTSRAQHPLGWHPRISWQDGLAENSIWFRDEMRASA